MKKIEYDYLYFFLFSETIFTTWTVRLMKIMKRRTQRSGVRRAHII